jgi:hypothetical protein
MNRGNVVHIGRSALFVGCVAACGGGGGTGAIGAQTRNDGGGSPESGDVQEAGPMGYVDVAMPNPAKYADVALPNPADYADAVAPMDFTDPVWLPPPSTNIEGDLTNLVGSWDEVLAYDGTLCTPTHSVNTPGCTHLDIRAGANGGYAGTLHRDPVSSPPPVTVSGPFAPAMDPTVGYPTTVSPSDDYSALRDIVAGVEYRMLDGVLTNGTLNFWISTNDLWSDWCALQTSFAWNVRGMRVYRCAAQTADQSNTDLGKLALCTSAQDHPTCSSPSYGDFPCVCLDSKGQFFQGPLCGRTVCECSASECRAAMRIASINATLQLQSGRLVGLLDINPPGTSSQMVTLQKVAP